jgi:signal transduction histidine kinase
MKLSIFIKTHLEEILKEWESFARTQLPAATGMSTLALRDHAKQILQTLAADIETDQSPSEQYQKSKGNAPPLAGKESAASTHGTLRQTSGFSLPQLIAEFRALRATVLRLWLPHVIEVTEETSEDMMRFNETIDQALAESAVTFSDQALRARDTFLAVLGHDLRSPLAAMSTAGDILTRPDIGPDRAHQVGVRVKRSAATMSSMVNDLLEYSRTQLSGEIPIAPRPTEMGHICDSSIHDAAAAHPDCTFEKEASGDLSGSFDEVRMQQVITNLLNNAAQYRGKEHPVTIFARGDQDEVVVQVKNRGPVIPSEFLQAIFDPLVQLSVGEQQEGRPSTSLGLGLFIAREITTAHGGTIEAESSVASGTIFTLRFPRTQARARATV